jgi:hypothetical protein
MERALRQAAPTTRRSRYSTAEIARESYYVPAAAELLIAAACDPEPSERRIRAAAALRWLDMHEDVLSLDGPDPLAALAAGIGRVYLDVVRGASPEARARAAALLAEISRLAADSEAAA